MTVQAFTNYGVKYNVEIYKSFTFSKAMSARLSERQKMDQRIPGIPVTRNNLTMQAVDNLILSK